MANFVQLLNRLDVLSQEMMEVLLETSPVDPASTICAMIGCQIEGLRRMIKSAKSHQTVQDLVKELRNEEKTLFDAIPEAV